MVAKFSTAMLNDFFPGFLAALFYGVVSGSMSFVNKIILTSYKYHFPDVVMFAQMVTTSLVLDVCRRLNLCDIPAWSYERGKEFVIPSICFATHTTLALSALDNLSIPIYNVLRRMLPLASLIVSVIVLKKFPSRGTILSVLLIVLGTLFAGFGDLRFDIVGYGDAIMSVVAQSIYLTYVQKSGLEKGASTLSILHLNSINCIPMLFIFTAANGHLLEGLNFVGFRELNFVIYFFINVIFGCLLNYSLFLCATKNSALTTSFVGVIKGVITTIVGFFTFGGLPATTLTVGGVTLNAIGGALYTYVKFSEKKDEVKKILSRTPSSPITVSSEQMQLNGMFHRHRQESGTNDDEDITIKIDR